MSIQRVIEIPLTEVRSANYEATIEALGEHSNTCLICGKRIKDEAKAKMVHLLTSGNIVSWPTDDIEESQGFFPVGYDCAKKLVINFSF